MSFKPGWARGPTGSAGVPPEAGVPRPSGTLQGSSLSKPPSMASKETSGQAPQHPSQVVNQFANLNMGTQARSAAAALTGDRRVNALADQSKTNLAPLGRVPATSGRYGKLTEQANLYQQQIKSPTPPPGGALLSSGGPQKIKYSREELLSYNTTSTRPNFPDHVNLGLISEQSQPPSFNDSFDQETIYREWQVESEKRVMSSRMASGQGNALTNDRRMSRNRRTDASDTTPDRIQPRGGGGFSAGGNWRQGGGAGMSSHKDGASSRFGGVARNLEKDQRWTGGGDRSTAGGNSRWGNLPASATDRRDSRNDHSGGSGGRWDRLSSGSSRPDRYGGNSSNFGRHQNSSSSSSGDPTKDALENSRWRRPGQQHEEAFDDKGTFSDEAVMGGMGLDSMADATERFAAEMEAMRQESQNGGGSNDRSPDLAPSQFASQGLMTVANDSLEPGITQPPQEKTLETPGWEDSPWAASNVPQPTQQASGGWVVPPPVPAAAAAQQQQQQTHQIPVSIPAMGQQQQQSVVPPPQIPQPPVLVDEWFYQDPHGNVQGPFKSEEMKEWLDHGYFSLDLLVRRGRGPQPFTQLGIRFPDSRKAFTAEADREHQQALIMQQERMLQQQHQQFHQGAFPQMFQDAEFFQPPLPQQQQQQQSEAFQQLMKQEQELQQRREEEERERVMQERIAKMQEERKRHEEERLLEAQRQERQAKEEAEKQLKAKLEAEEKSRQEQLKRQKEEQERQKKDAERIKAEEKPAWGGVAVAPPVASTLSLKEIQEIEEREAQKRPSGHSEVSMAARISQAAGVATLPTQVQPQQTAVPVRTSPAQPSGNVDQDHVPVNAYGNTLNEMSVDLRAMLGVGGGGKKGSSKPAPQREKSAWGGSSALQAQGQHEGKSLKDIQEDESRQHAAIHNAKMQQQQQAVKASGLGSSSGWASKAKPISGTAQLWDFEPSNAPTPAMAAKLPSQGKGWDQKPTTIAGVVASNIPKKLSNPVLATTGQVQNVSRPLKDNERQQLQQQQQQQSMHYDTAADKDNFGGKVMSQSFRKWCEAQVQKLGATMTLVEFCYALEDASDIREYLRDYLGSTPQVSAFATEFIKRKSSSDGNSQAADSVDAGGFAPVKKTKKKKRTGQ